MRWALLPIAVLLLYIPVLAQSIDSLRTEGEVGGFVKRLQPPYNEVSLPPCAKVVGLKDSFRYLEELGAKSFEKADLDGNGYTDLLINGYVVPSKDVGYCQRSSFVVLAFGQDSFQIKGLSIHQGLLSATAARTLVLGRHTYITTVEVRLLPMKENMKSNPLYIQTDTLDCVSGDFVEKTQPGKYDIEKIDYSVGGGLGFSGFEISITGDSALLIGDSALIYKKSDGISPFTKFAARVDTPTLSRIYALLRYMNVPNMKDHYVDLTNATDNVSGMLEITYDHGKKKRVFSEVCDDTYGLMALYHLFEGMIKSQRWTELREPIEGIKPDEGRRGFRDL